VRPYGLTGRQAETALREAAVTLNRNVIPFDPNGSWYTSGLRLGTPAVTTLGMGAEELREVAEVVHRVLEATEADSASKARYTLPERVRDEARGRVRDLLDRHPLYPGISL
jgi:glycine hydroxymethyltransferase